MWLEWHCWCTTLVQTEVSQQLMFFDWIEKKLYGLLSINPTVFCDFEP